MTNHQKLTAVAILVSLLAFSCVSEQNSKNDMSSRSGPPQGQEMPQPSESELTIMRLRSLVDNSDLQTEIAITTVQAAAIIPILEEWLELIESDADADTAVLVDQIASELTPLQNRYMPAPPEGDSAGGPPGGGSDGGPPGGGGDSSQGPPPGGAMEEISIIELLPDLIEDLKAL